MERLTRLPHSAPLRLGGRPGPGGIARMRRLLPLAVAVLALAGCDPAVQARYQPTSVDEVFGAFSRVGGVDDEVHELPAPPPAVDTADLRTRPCRPPGVVMKPTDMVGILDDRAVVRRGEVTPLVAMYEPPLPSPPPGPAHRLSSWNQHYETGAKENIATPLEYKAVDPGRSIYRNEPSLYGAYRRDVYAWCNEAANRR